MVATRSSSSSVKKDDKKKKITKEKKERKEQKPLPPSNDDSLIDKEPEDDNNLEEEEEDDELDDEEDLFENDYELPKEIEENNLLSNKTKTIIESLKKDEPSLEKILSAKIRFKRRKELFEWYYIYRYSFPNSEDRILLKNDINDRLKQYEKEYIEFKKNKDIFLKMEKMKKEEEDIYYWKRKLLNINTTDENHKILFQKCNELENREYHDEEYYKLLFWFRKALTLPFNNMISIQTENASNLLKTMKERMDNELYGMEKVKEQILLYVHNKLLFPSTQSQCLGLIGPPGVGKTSIALCLSDILKIPFEQISLGGVTHADFIKGHDFTFVGSKPGVIANSMIRMKCKNGILFLDEFEKISENKDVVNSLLHITDTTQNSCFKDNFFGEIGIDLSKVWFICSMNEKPLDKALSDRIFYIKVDGYSQKDKIEIIKTYLLPRALENIGLKKNDISIENDVIERLIQKIGNNEEGIRLLKQSIASIISKIAFLVNNQELIQTSFSLTKEYYPLQYPIQLDFKMLNIFVKEFEKERNINLDYLYV